MSGDRRIYVLLNGAPGSGRHAVSRALRQDERYGPLLTIEIAALTTAAAVRDRRRRALEFTEETSVYRLVCDGTSRRTEDPIWRDVHDAQERAARSGDLGYVIDTGDGDAAAAAARILADRDRPVEIVAPEATWASAAAELIAELEPVLGESARGIHHVGSTSVRGLPAKPILDLMADVSSLANAYALVGPLADLGFRFNDHPQNTDRMVFGRTTADRSAHLHLVETGSGELERHVGFRDALRRDDALRDAYAAMKRRVARDHPNDRMGYSTAKDDFIRDAERRIVP